MLAAQTVPVAYTGQYGKPEDQDGGGSAVRTWYTSEVYHVLLAALAVLAGFSASEHGIPLRYTMFGVFS